MVEKDEGAGGEQDNLSFLRTEDIIALSCIVTTASGSERKCLGAEGFGNRMCFLESIGRPDLVPPDIPVACFVLEQSLSVRALEEMISSKAMDSAQQSGHRTLLYGHAVLLRHHNSDMYLSSLSTSTSGDKLAFDVGLIENQEGESCWWTIHPASKQRSDGEKVRVGDDLIIVSVATERYLHIAIVPSQQGQPEKEFVNASFQQNLWTVYPMRSGAFYQKYVGYVYGGDVIRLFHGHLEECLTIPAEKSQNVNVMYETGGVCSHARSLWRVEHPKTKWAGAFVSWDLPVRFRHLTSGRYLAVLEETIMPSDDDPTAEPRVEYRVVTVHRRDASDEATLFIVRQSKDEKFFSEIRDDDGMLFPNVKYSESMIYLQHAQSNLWLSYKTYETKRRGVGRVEEKQAVVLPEGHMDDGLTFSRSQIEENRSGRVIRKCITLFNKFIRALDLLKSENRKTINVWSRVSLGTVVRCLEDLIEFFSQPTDDFSHEERQSRLRALRNRQDLFQEEGMISLILQTIDKFSIFKSRRHFAHYVGEDFSIHYEKIYSSLYLLLAAIIKGNRTNCAEFSDSLRLDWLVNKLEAPEASTGVVDVLHCVLIDSPEALNVVKEQHIQTIIKLIDKHGRQPKVLEVLCSLCVGNQVAVRANQNLIADNLLPTRDLLLQTKQVDYCSSLRPNIFVGAYEGAPMYPKWYYEVEFDHIEAMSDRPPFSL